jgi:hypothetical protein
MPTMSTRDAENDRVVDCVCKTCQYLKNVRRKLEHAFGWVLHEVRVPDVIRRDGQRHETDRTSGQTAPAVRTRTRLVRFLE